MIRLGWLLPSATVIAGLIVATARPASAAVTTAALAAGSPTSNGPCPFTEKFTGTINGTPGTSFQYSFNRYINGAQQIQAVPGTSTIPASGSVAVNDSFSVPTTSSGVNFDQIWVHNISGGQMDVYSNRAPFNVNCVTGGTPAPSGSPSKFSKFGVGAATSATELVYGVPPPYNVASTTDPHVCGTHGGLAGVFCIQAIPDRYLILVWNWDPNDKWPSIDGYHIYDVTNGARTRVQDQTNPQATVEFFKPGSFVNKCYAVSAYKGTTESRLSAQFCTSGAQVGTKLKAVRMSDWAFFATTYSGCGATAGICVVGTHCDDMCVGWAHNDSGSGLSLNHVNVYWRSYILFDSSQITGLNIARATLALRIKAGDPTCFGGVGVAQAHWAKDQEPGVSWVDVTPAMNATQAAFDVTSIVRGWATGAPNFGLALRGRDEDNGAEDNGYCMLHFDPNGALSIEYY